MGIKLDELIESTELNADDIMHLRTVGGLDKKIAVDNMPATVHAAITNIHLKITIGTADPGVLAVDEIYLKRET